jgi:hypothetical protein
MGWDLAAGLDGGDVRAAAEALASPREYDVSCFRGGDVLNTTVAEF